jgi:hypothetical protein
MGSIRATATAVLALGVLASMSAVVPMFDQLLRGSKPYLVVTSAIGCVAAVAGVSVLVAESEAALAVMVVSMITLWLIATIHHGMLSGRRQAGSPGLGQTQERPPSVVR